MNPLSELSTVPDQKFFIWHDGSNSVEVNVHLENNVDENLVNIFSGYAKSTKLDLDENSAFNIFRGCVKSTKLFNTESYEIMRDKRLKFSKKLGSLRDLFDLMLIETSLIFL